MPTGGDIIEATFNHPTIGSGVLYPKAGEDSSFDPGGFTSEDDAQGIDGGGRMIDKMKRKRWSVSLTPAWDMNVDNELQKVQALMNSAVLADWTVTHINGTVWKGKGKPV